MESRLKSIWEMKWEKRVKDKWPDLSVSGDKPIKGKEVLSTDMST